MTSAPGTPPRIGDRAAFTQWRNLARWLERRGCVIEYPEALPGLVYVRKAVSGEFREPVWLVRLDGWMSEREVRRILLALGIDPTEFVE